MIPPIVFIILASSFYSANSWIINPIIATPTRRAPRFLTPHDENQQPLPSSPSSRARTRCYASSSSSSSTTGDDIQILGYGKDAIIREGICIVAPPEEANHYLNDAVIFI